MIKDIHINNPKSILEGTKFRAYPAHSHRAAWQTPNDGDCVPYHSPNCLLWDAKTSFQ
jgi:hypothetical protein